MALPFDRLVAEVTVAVDAAGTLQTFYFGTQGFTTRPTDTPANTEVLALLVDGGSFSRELFSGARVSGGVRSSFGELVLNNSAGLLDGWIAYGTGNGRVVLRSGTAAAAYPAGYTTVYVARIRSLRADFASLRLVLRDRSYLFDKPAVVQTFAGTGGKEGTAASGRRKHLVIGSPGLIPPVPIDAERGLHFVQANAAQAAWLAGQGSAHQAVYDAGVPMTHDGRMRSWETLRTEASAGPDQYALWADAGAEESTADAFGPVYLRSGNATAPRGELRVRASGWLKNNAADTLRRWRFTDWCQRAGLADVTPSTLAAGSVDFSLGDRLVDGESFAEVLNDCARAELLAYGLTREDQAFAFYLKDPADTSDPADVVQHTFTASNAREFVRLPVPGMENPVYQVLVQAGSTWPCSVSDEAPFDIRTELERRFPFVSFSATAEGVRQAFPGAESVSVEVAGRYFTTPAARQVWSGRYLELYGGQRDFFRFTCTEWSAATLSLELHAKVQLELPRFACTPARTFRVVSIRLNVRDRTIDFGLWGGEPGPSTDGEVEVSTGGDPPSSAGGGSVPGASPLAAITAPDRRLVIAPFRVRAWGHLTEATRGRLTIAPVTLRGSGRMTVADAYRANVVLLLHGDGTNNSTTITDSSPYAHSLSAMGGTVISTAIAAMFGGASIKVAASGDGVLGPDHAAFDFGTGAFCVIARVYLTSFSGGNAMMLLSKSSGTSGLQYEWAIEVFEDGVAFYYGIRGTNQKLIFLYWPSPLVLNQIIEIAIQRDAYGQWACFARGVKGTQYMVSPLATTISYGPVVTGVYTDAVDIGATTNPIRVGAFHLSGYELLGYCEEVCFLAGAAPLTASYSPATAARPDI